MILVDSQIEAALAQGRVEIEPWRREQLQPASYDMRLSPQIRRIDPQVEILDPFTVDVYTVPETYRKSFLLHPGEFVLASSIETFSFANDMIGQINGKSSLARLGLQIESAGFFDPGFRGQATLELVNMTQRPIRLYAGMKIAQMVFIPTSQDAERPYGSVGLNSKYMGQVGPTPSRAFKE